MKEAGYEVEILNWNRGVNAEIIEEATKVFQAEGIQVHSIYCGHTPYGKGIITIINKLKFVLKVMAFLFKNGQQYKVVHAIDFDLGLPVYAAKRLKPSLRYSIIYDIADFVETFHGPMPQSLRSVVKKISERIMKKADSIVIPDDNRLRNIPSALQHKTVIINNSIDPPKDKVDVSLAIDQQQLNIFYYGALSKDRGIELLLQQKNAVLWFAGKGELQGEIEQLAAASTTIHYLGYMGLAEILSVAAQMDVIYMVYDPSYEHNQIASPNKLYEALYLGKPCIVAENTSIDTFVEKHDIGYVTKFDVASLAAVIQKIDKSALATKGANAQQIYFEHSWEQAKRKLVDMYEVL